MVEETIDCQNIGNVIAKNTLEQLEVLIKISNPKKILAAFTPLVEYAAQYADGGDAIKQALEKIK